MCNILVCMLLIASAAGNRPDLRTQLGNRVAEYRLSASSLADAVISVSKEFQVPVGLEWVRDKETQRSIVKRWEGKTIGEILESIIEEYPGYNFDIQNGVVHVFRRDLLNDKSNFLNLAVPAFFGTREEFAGLTNMALKATVQNIVSPRELPAGAGEAGEYATGINERRIKLDLEGQTIRVALEKMAAASEHNIWVVTFSESLALTPTGFRRVETLCHPNTFPDTEQPMWDFLAWSEPTPRAQNAVH
jgi:hypothetical protein